MDSGDFDNLIGLTWDQARVILSAHGVGAEAITVRDITPDRAPRTPTQQFGWGETRVLRARVQSEGKGAVLTVACEMKA